MQQCLCHDYQPFYTIEPSRTEPNQITSHIKSNELRTKPKKKNHINFGCECLCVFLVTHLMASSIINKKERENDGQKAYAAIQKQNNRLTFVCLRCQNSKFHDNISWIAYINGVTSQQPHETIYSFFLFEFNFLPIISASRNFFLIMGKNLARTMKLPLNEYIRCLSKLKI